MQVSTPRRLSMSLAILITITVAIVLTIDIYFVNSLQWLFILVSLIFLVLLIYFGLTKAISSFIVSQIRPLYHTIDSMKIPDEELYKKIENNDYLTEIEAKVVNWAKKKTKEIALLKANEKYRKEFLGNISHELKTPLFNIQGYVLTLIDEGINDPEINIKYLRRAEKNINRLISLINDLDSITKLEAGVLKLNFENFNIVPLIDEVFEIHEMKAKEHSIQLSLLRRHRGQLYVFADKRRIFEVISNLVLNSIIYGKNSGTTTVDLIENEDKVIIEVTDDGIGIDKKHIKRIFERFYRVDKSRSRDVGGTGLGLSIVKHIIEGHGQKINVISTIDKGSTFSFALKKGSFEKSEEK